MDLLLSTVLFLAACSCLAHAECGYKSCNPVKDDMVNVHLVPHTHDDVGWLKTVDQYFYGARNDIQNAGVQYVLDSVIPELQADPTKRFIYVEIAFFARWWDEQNNVTKELVKSLVDRGSLEFILGGWCMNDEATTHYQAIIDQHTLGFDFLKKNFGSCGRPRVAWQIDPFGHSREQASLFAQMGYDGLFFGRLDYQDKDNRLNHSTMEMMWHGSANLGEKADLFTGALYNGYGPPNGFNWDQFSQDAPIMDDKRLHDYNVDERVGDFVKAVTDQAKHFATNHIVMTMGSDFQYQNANHWYKNMDKLIKYTNELQSTNGSKINVLYSTPSCYLYQLNRADKTWTTKSDDFFPYADKGHSFWTGYFTSRAALKGYIRKTSSFLQACKQLTAMAKRDYPENRVKLNVLKEAMGVAQHHDAVTGTEKQAVAYDYALRLAKGVAMCEDLIVDSYIPLLQKGWSVPIPEQHFCSLLNISDCRITETSKEFTMIVYNPFSKQRDHWMRLPVIGKAYIVIGPDGKPIETQIIPITSETKRIPERNGSMAVNELVFQVSVPALGVSTYFISMSNSRVLRKQQMSVLRKIDGGEDFSMSNKHLSLKFDGKTGKLKKMVNLATGIDLDVQQDIVYYFGYQGNCSKDIFQASGAYIFRPNETEPKSWTGPSAATQLSGPLVSEVYMSYSPWVSQVIRIYKDSKHVELEWTVGPIPIKDKAGKEIVARFETGLNSQGLFYTDANGREILERRRDYRPTWNLNQTEPVAGNYYPINSRIYLQDKAANQQFTILNDRSQGGGSIKDGQLEIMLHRRLLVDDHFGVGEPLNETGADGEGLIVRGKLYMMMDTIENSPKRHRDLAQKLFYQPVPSFSVTEKKYPDYIGYYRTTWSGVNRALPENVNLLTLEQLNEPGQQNMTYLVRLEHFYEKNEDPVLSQPVSIQLENLFQPFNILHLEELILGANLPVAELQRLKWKTTDDVQAPDDDTLYYKSLYKRSSKREASIPKVTLNPMEIRTFHATISEFSYNYQH